MSYRWVRMETEDGGRGRLVSPEVSIFLEWRNALNSNLALRETLGADWGDEDHWLLTVTWTGAASSYRDLSMDEQLTLFSEHTPYYLVRTCPYPIHTPMHSEEGLLYTWVHNRMMLTVPVTPVHDGPPFYLF